MTILTARKFSGLRPEAFDLHPEAFLNWVWLGARRKSRDWCC